ncbi:MAG: hypothetical protein ACLS54_13210 [Anaerostipes hadrus]
MYNGEFNGVFVNVNASEDQEMITSNQVLEDGFVEETEEEEFLNFSTKVNVDLDCETLNT